VNELDVIREAAGVATKAVYHVTKYAIRENGELRSGASSGSLQLEDLSRWVLNARSLAGKEAGEYGLDPKGYYVEALVTKSNYTPPMDKPLVFKRVSGGALLYVDARPRADQDDAAVLAALFKAGNWITREQWQKQIEDGPELTRDRAREARKRLETTQRVERIEVRIGAGRVSKSYFAPAAHLRPTDWPSPPVGAAEAAS